MFATRTSNKWIAIFNAKFEEFVKDLITIFPDDKDFKLLKNSFGLMKLADENKPFELFSKYGAHFEIEVKNRDENFFLNHSYKEVVDSESNFTEDIVNKLKNYWKDMGPDDKKAVWDYLTLFFELKKRV